MAKTALVLSAGGSFGAYQVGVWKVLERELRPDIVVGTSIGSIHAWCIAGGATAADLEQMWLDPSRAPQFRLRLPRSWRHGVFDPRRMERQIEELHTRFQPQRPVGIVCTGIGSLRQRLFTNGEITWRHIAGSCAVPGVLDLRQLDGATYADGGLFDSVNVWAAFEMGAERVIAVNCWKPRPIAIIDRPLGWLAQRRRKQIDEPAQAPPLDGWIEPVGDLGSFADSLRWQPERIRHWIELGTADALRLKQFWCGMF
jgi:NTE family protein